ncbi:hypothetical protein GN956_G15684 [Arapaima gigas]
MEADGALNPVLTAVSGTVLSGGEIAPVFLSPCDLCPVSEAAGAVGCEDAAEGTAPLDGTPVTVSLRNVDTQQRIVCVAAGPSGGALCYAGQLPSDPGLDFHPEVLPQPILSEDDVAPLPSAAELLPIHLLPPALQPLDPLDPLEPLQPMHACLLLDGEPEPRDLSGEEPKKRRGGWPKGKKRKPQREFSAPRTPTTGYVIFVNEQKVRLKAENPDLPFIEITKMLGIQWSQLSGEDKQRYNDMAEKDKQRYIQELMAFQNTEAYRAFMKRKALTKAKGLCGIECNDADLENEVLALSQMDGDENSDLYCRTCNQYFSSLHNKKEHLLGRQHLLTLTEEFEKEKGNQLRGAELEEEPEEADAEKEEEETELGGLSSVDLSVLEELLLRHVNLRDLELQELKASSEQARRQQEDLRAVLQQLQQQKCNLEQELRGLRENGGALESQIRELKVVPRLFQLHQHLIGRREVPPWGGTAERAEQDAHIHMETCKISLSTDESSRPGSTRRMKEG